jgi:hypothetical protein
LSTSTRSAPAGSDGVHGPLLYPEWLAGVAEECRAVDGQSGAARSTGEQPDAEVAFQGGEAFRDGLLTDAEVGGGELELPFLCNGDEGPDRFHVQVWPPPLHN